MPKKLKQLILSHDLSHELKPKKKYSEPKIQHYNYDMSRIWYVYFRFRNPVTGYMERMDNIYCSVTLSKAERLEYLKKIKSNLSDMLKKGFNPTDVDNENEEIINYSISEAFDFALNLKKQTQNTTTFTNYKSRIKKFETWLNQNGFEKRYISLVTKKVINNYLNSILEKTSARNRDNTRLDLSSLFQVLEDNEIIVANPVSKIKAVGSTPEKNKPFSFEQEKIIFEYIEKKKLHLLLTYIQHISWAFFRPVECNRLHIKDVDLHDKIYRIKTKTGFKIKIIPEILLNQLPDLSNYEPESFLFGLMVMARNGMQKNQIEETNITEYF